MRFVNVCGSGKDASMSYSEISPVVDLASFRPDAEQVRAFKFNPQGVGSVPQYDYSDGQIPKDDTVSPAIVALRSGRLDKADAARLQRSIIEDARRMNDKAKADKVEKALNKTLGLDGDSSESKQN